MYSCLPFPSDTRNSVTNRHSLSNAVILKISPPLCVYPSQNGQLSSKYFEEIGPGRDRNDPDRDEGDCNGEENENDEPDTAEAADVAEIYTDELRAQFPMSFGEQEKKGPLLTEAHAANRRSFGPPRPDTLLGAAEAAGDVVDRGKSGSDAPAEEGLQGRAGVEEEQEEDEEDPYNMPVTHEIQLKGHSKLVSAVAIDRNGARALTGSLDYTVQMWDFNGMKSDLRSFRKLEPSEGHPVLAVSFSPSGEAFLVVTGSACPKVYDRDGRELGEFPRGDMYIRDMKNTKGHISGCTFGSWHPSDRFTALTSSEDGSIRLWDCENIVQKTVIKPQLAKPGRVGATTCAFSEDGGMIAAGMRDGTVQLWSVKGKFGTSAAVGLVPVPKQQLIARQTWSYVSRPNHLLHKAHEPGSEITSIGFSRDGHTLITRGGDETLKVWDIRKFKSPLKVFGELPTTHGNTMCAFSPDERLIITGVCAPSGDEDGGLVMFDKERLEFVRRVGMPGSVCSFDWNVQLNQILVGAGGRKSGAAHMLYHPTFSEKGALRCVGRAPRKAMPFDFQVPLVIHNPHALPLFREERSRKRQRDKDRADPTKSRRPDTSGITTGPGRGGKLGATGGTLLTQHLLKQAGNKRPDQEEDPRESILRHAGEAETEPRIFGSAYGETQPKPIFADVSDDEEKEEK
uniref:Wd repeat-containing protein 70-like n=1 Tax=Tetraselmis sp. GSL018 TaxID=582737 RepID=A0A061QZ94_9CHLO